MLPAPLNRAANAGEMRQALINFEKAPPIEGEGVRLAGGGEFYSVCLLLASAATLAKNVPCAVMIQLCAAFVSFLVSFFTLAGVTPIC
jgi:hypothetical protein